MLSVPSFLVTIVTVMSFFHAMAGATRLFERRDDFTVPPVAASGWSVPLQGSDVCRYGGSCTDHPSLTSPTSNKGLYALAIGKGLFNFSCAQGNASTPAFVSQYTELYNAATLTASLPDEDAFHALVSSILDYNYEQDDNGTLNCMGSIGTLDGTAVITLFDIDTFEIELLEQVPPSDDSEDKNAFWTRSVSTDKTWDVYRVETSGGQPPASCQDQPDVMEIQYAAEYWFYRQSAGAD